MRRKWFGGPSGVSRAVCSCRERVLHPLPPCRVPSRCLCRVIVSKRQSSPRPHHACACAVASPIWPLKQCSETSPTTPPALPKPPSIPPSPTTAHPPARPTQQRGCCCAVCLRCSLAKPCTIAPRRRTAFRQPHAHTHAHTHLHTPTHPPNDTRHLTALRECLPPRRMSA